MRAVVAALLLLAGCLSGSYSLDMNVSARDMAMPAAPPPDLVTVYSFDLSGVDLYGLSNCGALNKCEQAATTAAQALMCRMSATPPAQAKEAALQSCFRQWCPVVADMGLALCTTNDMGARSSACQACINNTYVGAGLGCTPAGAPECHMCLGQAQTCAADQ
jgi:hypothetical protein